jgi:hypothetical protein
MSDWHATARQGRQTYPPLHRYVATASLPKARFTTQRKARKKYVHGLLGAVVWQRLKHRGCNSADSEPREQGCVTTSLTTRPHFLMEIPKSTYI